MTNEVERLKSSESENSESKDLKLRINELTRLLGKADADKKDLIAQLEQ